MRHKRKRKSLRNKLLFFLIFLIGALLFFLILKIPVIREVAINGGLECIGDSKLVQTDALRGQSLLFVDEKRIEKEIKERYICIKQIKLNKVFPDKINIDFSARTAKAEIVVIERPASESAEINNLEFSIASSSSELKPEDFPKKGVFLTDEDGVIFLDKEEDSLPKIYTFSDLRVGQKMGIGLAEKILKIISKLSEMGMDVKTSFLTGYGTYLMYSNPKIYFTLEGNLDFQVASLQLILNKSKIDRDVMFIDLRFDKPIVKFAPTIRSK